MKSKAKNTIILILALVVIVGGVFFTSELASKKAGKTEYKSAIVEKFKELYNGENPSIVYLGQTGCGACQAFTPVIDELKAEKKFDYYYIDLATMSRKDTSLLYASDPYFTTNEIATPTLLIVGNGKVITSQVGYLEKAELYEFLKSAGIK